MRVATASGAPLRFSCHTCNMIRLYIIGIFFNDELVCSIRNTALQAPNGMHVLKWDSHPILFLFFYFSSFFLLLIEYIWYEQKQLQQRDHRNCECERRSWFHSFLLYILSFGGAVFLSFRHGNSFVCVCVNLYEHFIYLSMLDGISMAIELLTDKMKHEYMNGDDAIERKLNTKLL